MVSELVKYTCDICNKIYNTKNEAIECESVGYSELPIFEIGDCYDFVMSVNRCPYDKNDYEGVEIIKITNIIKSHKIKYICDVYDEIEEEWYMKGYVIEGNDYFEHWNRGRVGIR